MKGKVKSMFKELRFDVVGAVKRAEKYDSEWEAIHQFASSDHKNMALDYDSAKDAHLAAQWLKKTCEKEKLPVKASVFRSKSVLVTRV